MKKIKEIFVMICTIMLVTFSVGTISASADAIDVNAVIVKDWAYVRDIKGNIIPGKRVDIGDKIQVDFIDNNTQQAYVTYPTSHGADNGYIKLCSIIKFYYQGQYHNGSTREPVYDDPMCTGKPIGSLDPYEYATPIAKEYYDHGNTYIVYNTSKGANTKAGWVKYDGGFKKHPGVWTVLN